MTPRPRLLPHGLRLSGPLGAAVLSVWLAGPVQAQSAPGDAPERKTFKVCQDPNNLPFSSEQQPGFENKLAELFAKDLGLPLQYYSFPNRLAFIRNTLRYKLPGEEYRCDLVMSVPAGFDQVAATQAYYRSTYVLVYPKGRALDGVKRQEDLLALPAERLKALRIGLFDRTPASQWLVKHGLVDNGRPYQMMNADPDWYPGQIIDRDLAEGKIDAAIIWGPIAGFFAGRHRNPDMVVVPMQSEPGVKFDFAMAMGVRHGEPQWKQQIDTLIAKHRDDIQAILRSYGVPLVSDTGAEPTR